jgi:YbbR domain-containing protein
VTSVDPASVRLHFAREQTRTDVPVEVAVGDPPPGHTVESVWPWPRRVSVRGPKRDVSGLQKVLTRRVTLDDGPPPKSMKIEGKAPVETGKKSIKCAETVEYTIYLARKSMKRRFEKTPIQFLMPPKYPYDVKLAAGSDDTLDIEVTGPENVIKDMKPEDVLLFVVVNRLTRPGQKEYLRVEWRIAGVSPTESVTIEGLKEEVPVEAVARPRTTP